MSAVKRPSRRYESPLREESARKTRQAVVAAATTLFAERGYIATSLAQVATAAGVARPTVFAAFGSKGALLGQVLDVALAGDDEPVAVADRPWFRPVWDAAAPSEVLDAYAGVCTLIGRRAARMFEVVRRAADDSPEVRKLWKTLCCNRIAGARMVVERAVERGAALDPERAVDSLWIFNDPAHYDALVHQRGWPEADFTPWLAARMRSAVLDL
ncbi:MAG TPA: helix-turn-helix domain-containing protein [Amycolatopsis sp.]|nr:helix-turn-helix domain-containing protein [Amycolatopsis sp.]